MATFVEPAAAQAAAAVVQALQDVDEEYNSECIPISNNSSSDSIVNKASISESLRQTEELAWIRHRLARKRQATRESEALRRQQQHNRSDDSRAVRFFLRCSSPDPVYPKLEIKGKSSCAGVEVIDTSLT